MTSEINDLTAPVRTGLTLVLGADAVGKSTFLDNLETRLGYATFEPTSTDEIRAFKKENFDTVVDYEFVNERRNLFLGLSLESDIGILDHNKAATTSSPLVTLASHDLMEFIIGTRANIDRHSIIERWKQISLFIPENIVYIQAPEEVIRKRIEARQQAGNETERFWGFNSPHFLNQYQQLLGRIFDELSSGGQITCVSLDSNEHDPNQMIEEFISKT